jgi:hypothetical protein
MKILLLDIETAPNTAHVWGLWQQNVGLPQILESGYVMCWAAKWLGDSTVYFDSIMNSSHKKMLKGIHRLLNEADAVVHYNGTKFDIPTLNKEFVLHGLTPPAPYKQIDLLQVARKQFKFPSNKLDYVADALGLGKKMKHIGHELWIKCMAKDVDSWKTMEEYNIHDVVLLEKVYNKLLPWIKNHPNQNLYSDVDHVCPNCSGVAYQKRGYAYTVSCKYQRYQCTDCGTWFRSNKAIKLDKEFVNVR